VQAQDRGDVDRGVDPKYASFYVLAAVNHVPDWYRRDGSDSPAHIAAAYADLTVGTLVGTRARPPARGNARQRSGAAAQRPAQGRVSKPASAPPLPAERMSTDRLV
jgi:hypothetical protein